MTDTNMSDIYIFITFATRCSANKWVFELLWCAHWVAFASLWEAPTIHIIECHYYSAYTIIISLNNVVWNEFIWGGGVF
jgi:hypothetical protein